ncbi:hypothetical protein [Streptomyces sp. NPDC046939]|uniref:hypothetical protein n=1 Tax=Streptomyces sp. NPDC046939 TaxID=3155376 RepID=UPI0033EE82E0
MTVRTPWWVNLIALAIAVAICVALGLPWWVAALAALATGTAADRIWAAFAHRKKRARQHDR